MMKSPTSLIRFRNAVGVMLAMSAIFAVVISAVTITQDRAFGQEEDVTVNLPAEAITVGEDDSTTTVTVTLGAAASGADVIIPVKVEEGTALASTATADPQNNDYVNPDPMSVTVSDGALTGDLSITIVSDDTDESQESFTVSLDTDSDDWPEGYAADANVSVTVNINDGDNLEPSPLTVTITIPDGDDADELPDTPTRGRGMVGQTLTADTSAVRDADHPDDAGTADVDESIVATSFPQGFSYQWTRINGDADTDPVTEGDPTDEVVGTDKTYTPVDDDVSKVLALGVTWSDRYGNGDAMADALSVTTTTLTATVYDEARPFIVITDTNDNDRRDPGDVLTRDISGMFDGSDQLINADGTLVDGNTADDGDDPVPAPTPVLDAAVTLTWHRDGMPILCDADGDGSLDEVDAEGNAGTDGVDDEICESTANTATGDTLSYTLTDADVASVVTLEARYTRITAVDDTDTADVDESASDMPILTSDSIGRVHSTNPATGQPQIRGTAQVGEILTASKGSIVDEDGLTNADADDFAGYSYMWYHGDDVDNSASIGSGTTYTLKAGDVGETIKVEASFNDDLGDPDSRTSAVTSPITGSPGEISRIEPVIRGVTLSAGDTVILSVDIYGLQDVKDNSLSGTFDWGSASDDTGREIEYEAPSSPGTYTITASLNDAYCSPEDEEMRADACSATFEVRVRRPSVAQPPEEAPVNPPGDIPGILADSDGNQYEVFTPVDGGTFSGEGYSLNVPSGAVPNGEFIGIRMSDDGAASNAGMTHQRYTLGGNMYGVHAVDSSGDSISSYALDDPATVCLPLPDALRQNISDLAVVAINGDGSLTILSAQVRISDAGTMVCGGLSNLPASVAVGSAGAPAAIPTPTPEPTPVAPDTGGTAPASSTMVLWALLLGIATLALGSVLVIGRRREGARK